MLTIFFGIFPKCSIFVTLHVGKASLVSIIPSLSHISFKHDSSELFHVSRFSRHIRTRTRTRTEMNVDLILLWHFRKHQPLAMAQGWWVGYISPVRLSANRSGILVQRFSWYLHSPRGLSSCRFRIRTLPRPLLSQLK